MLITLSDFLSNSKKSLFLNNIIKIEKSIYKLVFLSPKSNNLINGLHLLLYRNL